MCVCVCVFLCVCACVRVCVQRAAAGWGVCLVIMGRHRQGTRLEALGWRPRVLSTRTRVSRNPWPSAQSHLLPLGPKGLARQAGVRYLHAGRAPGDQWLLATKARKGPCPGLQQLEGDRGRGPARQTDSVDTRHSDDMAQQGEEVTEMGGGGEK